MNKILLTVLALSLAAPSVASNAQPANSYTQLSINEMGEIVQIQSDGQETTLNVVQDYTTAQVVTNHAGEFAVLASEEPTSEVVNLATVSSSSDVELVWDNPDNLSGVLVRDGVPVTDIDSSGFFIDEEVLPGATYEYTLEFADTSIYSESQDELIDLTVTGTSVSLPISSSFSATAMVAAASLPEYTIMRYLTFIKDAYVPVPSWGCVPWIGTHFLGNNRTYSSSATAQQSKTILTVRVDWDSATFRHWNYVGPTTTATKDGTNYTNGFTIQAGDQNVYAAELRPTLSTSAEFLMHTQAANPFCGGLPIYSSLNVLVKRTGNYLIKGKVRFVPHHEFYMYQDNTDFWTTIYRKNISSIGFSCFDPFLTETSTCIDDVTMSTGGTVVYGN
jgi:hypothetical protein